MRRLWRAWVELQDQQELPVTLAMVRIGVALIVLVDLAAMARHGLVVPLLGTSEVGGFASLTSRGTVPWPYLLLPATENTAWILWAAMGLAAAALFIGLYSRIASLSLLVLLATTATFVHDADRGIDLLLRNVLLLLTCSSAGRAWSVDAWRRTGDLRGDGSLMPAWPRYLLILQLVVVYFAAGIAKAGIAWTPMGGYRALWWILNDPAISSISTTNLAAVAPLLALSTAISVTWEYTAPLVLYVFWLRYTGDRGGRLRHLAVHHRPEWVWLAIGVVFHLGIALTLRLGIFPWAMLALYPTFVNPHEWPSWTRPPVIDRRPALQGCA